MGKRKTTSQFKKEVFEKCGDEYEVLGEYIRSNEKILMKHKTCGETFRVRPTEFLHYNYGCYPCKMKKRSESLTKTTEKFKEEVYNLVGNEYSVIGEYIKSNIDIEIKHNLCGRILEVPPTIFLLGRRCSCTRKPRHKSYYKEMTEKFKKEVYDLVGNEYEVIGKYDGYKKKIVIKHIDCSKNFEVTRNQFLKGSRCPNCEGSISHGENVIQSFLDSHCINYQRQYAFDDCKYEESLYFDYAIFDDSTLCCLIEFDGEQHYRPIEHFGGEQTFRKIKLRDKAKNSYCRSNNIYLIRIPYWDIKQIHDILKYEFKKLNIRLINTNISLKELFNRIEEIGEHIRYVKLIGKDKKYAAMIDKYNKLLELPLNNPYIIVKEIEDYINNILD